MSTKRIRPALVIAIGAAAASAITASPTLAAGPHSLTSDLVPGVTARIFTPLTSTISIPRAVRRDCLAGRRSGAGVATTRFLAPADGQLTAHLKGRGTSSDWDLAAFDAQGRRLKGSGAFFANEVVKVDMAKGQTVTLQVCRRTGATRRQRLTTTFVGVRRDAALVTPRMQRLKVRILGRAEFDRLEKLAGTVPTLDVTHDVRDGRAIVLAYGAPAIERLRAAGFLFQVLDGDMAATERKSRAADRAYTRAAGVNGSPLPSGRTEYRFIEDYYTELKKLVEENPTLVKPYPLKGRTGQGRELVAVEIAEGVTTPPEGRPYFVLNAMHHAREWPAAESAMEFALDLIKSYKAGDPRVVKLLQTTRIVVQPMTNVDGYDNSRNAPLNVETTGIAPLPGIDQYRRKNCNFPFPSVVPCYVQTGVDPNRNYPESWGGPGASSMPDSQTYRGPAPSSEPEVTTVRELISSVQATSMLTIHNVAALVLRPPGLEADGLAPDEAGLKALGDKMGKATDYTSQYGWELYDTTGTTDDWSYAATSAYGYTIEMGPVDGGFHGPFEVNVVDEYVGFGRTKGKGLREAYLLAAEHATNAAVNSQIVGRAPAGRTLRLKKAFTTETFTVCLIQSLTPVTGGQGAADECVNPGARIEVPEKIETTMTVPASGRFTYWTNPSTRPFVKRAGKTESWTLTCEDAGKVVETHQVTLDRGQVAKLDMPCGGTLVEEVKPIIKKVLTRAQKLRKCQAQARRKSSKKARSKALKTCQKKYGKKKSARR